MKPAYRSWLRILVALAAGMLVPAGAGEPPPRLPEVGIPFIRNYAPKEFGADSQNWSVAQDARGLIYVANNQGVLEYDGVRWRLIRTPNKTVVRSLAADERGRIYVGAVGEIGYLGPDERGQARFIPLTERIAAAERTFSDVWVTASTPRGVVFQSRECLFLLSGDRIQTFKATTTFHVAFNAQGRIFVRQRNVGLMELKAGGLALLPGGERFAKESVFAMLTLDAAGGEILIGSRNQGLWRYDGARISAFPSEADAFLKANALYSGTRLGDGTLAFATITGGVAFMDPQGRLRGVLDRASGLQGDNVKFLFADRRSSLWLALDNGISKVEWPSPITLFDERMGLKGTVWSMQRHQGDLYVATGQGGFKLDAEPVPGEPLRFRAAFKPLEGVKTQSLGFLSMEDDLLIANSQGVFDLRGGKPELVRPSSNVAISLRRSTRDPERVFVGLQGGLASLHRSLDGKKRWTDEGIIPGVAEDIYSLVEGPGGELWMGTGAQGVLRATFPTEWKGGTTGGAPRIDRFGEAQGLPPTTQTFVLLVGGIPTFTTHQGVFRFDETAKRFVPDPRFEHLLPDGLLWVKAMAVDPSGRVWLDAIDEAKGTHETGEAVAQKDGSYRWEAAPFRRFSESAVESIYPEGGGTVWFGGPGGIFRFDPAVARPQGEPFAALI
ncbi:MAG TPA: hypothetical protein VJ483_04595, partial [Holophagaceae bacterium]|nr:hypothetical protein [Holophagaceae bacterium]